MWNNCKKQLILHRACFWESWLVTAGAWLAGDILSVMLLIFSDSTKYVSIGGILGIFGAVLFSMGIGVGFFSAYYETALSMGQTRKGYIVSAFTTNFMVLISNLLLLLPLSSISELARRTFFSSLATADGFYGIFNIDFVIQWWWVGLLASFFMVCCGMCIGALIQRWGRKAFWVLWGVYIVGFLFGGKFAHIMKNINPSSVTGRFFTAVSNFLPQGNGLILVFGVIFVSATLLTSILLLRRGTVKN